MFKLLMTAAVAVAAAGSAHAASFTSAAGAPDPGVPTGETLFVDFEGGLLPTGVTLSGSYSIQNGTIPNLAATPALDTTDYLSVPDATADFSNGTATLSFSDRAIRSFSFYWGSIDAYNTLELLGADGVTAFLTVFGSEMAPANGDQGAAITNRRAYFTLAAGEVLTGLRFISGQRAFELDSLSIGVADVPEPAALSLLGMGLMGVAATRRRRA